MFFFNDTATTEIYTLSLHDALPILNIPYITGPNPVQLLVGVNGKAGVVNNIPQSQSPWQANIVPLDRKSTRLNSSHANISYAVFCLKKKNALHANYMHEVVMSNVYK